MWRYRELLPVADSADAVSLGETATPVVALPGTARAGKGSELSVKDEGRLPMASIKARGLAIAGLARRDKRAVAFNTGTSRRSDMPAAERRLDVSRPIELTSP